MKCVLFLHLKKDYVQDLIKQVEQCATDWCWKQKEYSIAAD